MNFLSLIFTSLMLSLFACATKIKHTDYIEPKVTNPNKYEDFGCKELAVQRLSVSAINENISTKHKNEAKKHCSEFKSGFYDYDSYFSCISLEERNKSKIKELERKIASYRGDLELIDSKFPTCKSRNDRGKVEIHNNVNIENNNAKQKESE